jgi:hypothetical protein
MTWKNLKRAPIKIWKRGPSRNPPTIEAVVAVAVAAWTVEVEESICSSFSSRVSTASFDYWGSGWA